MLVNLRLGVIIMAVCTFFGHRECPGTIKPVLRNTLEDLIINHGVDLFYVGNQGQFDACVRSVLQELKKEYPQTHYAVVLAYMPGIQNEYEDFSDTMLPEGIESVHPRFAISWRNDLLLRQTDFVVTYITHTWGGAYKYAEKAKKLGKIMIDTA